VQHDLQVARSIQQSLLPQETPRSLDMVAGWNHPADDTGGDYFDWKTPRMEKWRFVSLPPT
jgi:hypothetical protein